MKSKFDTKPSFKREITSLLRRFASQLQAMDDEDFSRILSGEKFEIRLREKREPKRAKSDTQTKSIAFDQLRQELVKAKSRKEARELIEENIQDQVSLLAFAQHIEVPIPKSASSEKIKDRLVEATVGYQFRSAAIRGTPRKS